MSLTQCQISAKRTERTMTMRIKRKARHSRLGSAKQDLAYRRKDVASWLSGMGKAHQDGAKFLEDAHKQVAESRRANLDISKHARIGMFDKVRSFFKVRGR